MIPGYMVNRWLQVSNSLQLVILIEGMFMFVNFSSQIASEVLVFLCALQAQRNNDYKT